MTAAEELAGRLGAAAKEGRAVRPVGGGTKLSWGRDAGTAEVALSTAGLGEIREHNAGDYVAVLEGGLRLTAAQARFTAAGQRLALDPPLGDGAATIGGVLATGDSGPLRHRYGAPRDLVVGMTVALSDGTLARAGGRVIKNVAGYDLAKLMTGSFGTLGVIVEAVVRLHPRPDATATAIGRATDPGLVAAAARGLTHERLELESLDVRWQRGEGAVLARAGGALPRPTAERAAAALAAAGLDVEVIQDDDEPLWEAQRAGQRASADGDVVVRVSSLQTRLEDVLVAARRLDAAVVGRAALGLSWVRVPSGGAEAVAELRAALAPAVCVVLDAPPAVRAAIDPWGEADPPALELMRRVKARFDPAGALRPGAFVGGL
jgi:glycolate oxidase FAD binding subunit